MTLPDEWILARLHRTLHTIEDGLAEYQFNVYAEAMYDFIWRDFCDWYLEAIKPTVKSNPAQQQVLRTVLNAALRLLHPICPFLTETLFPSVAACGFAGIPDLVLGDSDLLAAAPWPDISCRIDDKAAHDRFARIQTLIESIRTLRGEHRVPDRKRVALFAPRRTMELIAEAPEVLRSLAGLSSVEAIPADRPRHAVPLSFEGEELLLVGLVEDVDEAARAGRLASEVAALEKTIATFEGRLANRGYVEKAPPEKVRETRDLLEQARRDLELKKSALETPAH